jgi:predicted phage tail protein
MSLEKWSRHSCLASSGLSGALGGILQMFAPFVARYNFRQRQMTLKTTAAIAAGRTHVPWTMERF